MILNYKYTKYRRDYQLFLNSSYPELAYYLKEAVENPLDVSYHFYLDGDGCQSFAEKSFAFMEFVCGLEPGTVLYIGGVIDYHF